jgi:hypothetical protein
VSGFDKARNLGCSDAWLSFDTPQQIGSLMDIFHAREHEIWFTLGNKADYQEHPKHNTMRATAHSHKQAALQAEITADLGARVLYVHGCRAGS